MFEMTIYKERDVDGHLYFFKAHRVGTTNGVREWCIERFGDPDWQGRWIGGTSADVFWFRDEADAFEFRMRWC